MKLLTAALLISLNWSLQQVEGSGNDTVSTCAIVENPAFSFTYPAVVDMENKCREDIVNHLKEEFKASLTYLAMGAHFLRDIHYRPGVAKFFIENAAEERAHAKGLIEYVLLRGHSIKSEDIGDITLDMKAWTMDDALLEALNKEIDIRGKFAKIIGTCENGAKNDYHASDKLTGVYLEEQHESIHKIAGHLSTLRKMKGQLGEFAEIMFDRTLIA